MKTIVIASFAKFPFSDSNALYLNNIGRIFNSNEYQISFVGFGQENYKDERFAYYTLSKYNDNSFIGKVLNHLFMDRKMIKAIKNKFSDVDAVIISGCLNGSNFSKLAKIYSHKSPKTKLIISMTEEYSRDEFDKFDYFTRRGFKRNRYLINDFNDKRFKFLCISKYLTNKFLQKGFDSMFLPFTFSNSFIGEIKRIKHDKINFLYSGSPNNKDNLLSILEAFGKLDCELSKKITLNIAGVSDKWCIDRDLSLFNKIKAFTNFYGRLKYDEVRELYYQTDYSLLLRDPTKIFSVAGCPTKITESLFFGVPPVTNISGDLSDFLKDDWNAIIVKENSVDSFCEALTRSIKRIDKITRLQTNAALIAQEKLESANYSESLIRFIFGNENE